MKEDCVFNSTTSVAAVPFQDPAIIEMRVFGNSKPNNRFNRQGNNGQTEKRLRRDDKNKSNNLDNKLDKTKTNLSENKKEKSGFFLDKRNRERHSRHKPQDCEYGKSKPPENKVIEDKILKSKEKTKGSLPEFSKNSKQSPNKSKSENKTIPENSDKLSNKNLEKPIKQDLIEKSNKIVVDKTQIPDGKTESKVSERSINFELNPTEALVVKVKTSSVTDIVGGRLELSHNVLQRRKSLEGKQKEKFMESGRRNSLDSGNKKNADEDGRDPRMERRIRNKVSEDHVNHAS